MVKKLVNILKSDKGLVLLDQAVVSGGNFVISILLARSMGLEVFGRYSVVWLLFFLFLSVVQAFVIQPLYTLGHKKYEGDIGYMPALQTITLLLVIMSVLVFIPVLWVLNYSGTLFLLQLTALFFYLINQSLRGMGFYKQHRLKVLMVDVIIQAGLVMSILAVELDLEKLFLILTLVYSLSIPLYRKLIQISFGVSKSKEVFRTHFVFSKWLLVTTGVQWLSGNYMILVADAILGHAVTGVIRIIQNTLGVFNILLQAMENYVPLKASYLFKHGGMKPMFHFVKLVGVYVLGIMMIGLTLFYFLYEPILEWCYEVAFTNDQLILMFCILYILILAGFILRFLIRTMEQNFAIFLGYIISSAIIFLVANPLVNRWGIQGVALGFLITQVVSIVVYIFYIQKKMRYENNTYHLREKQP